MGVHIHEHTHLLINTLIKTFSWLNFFVVSHRCRHLHCGSAAADWARMRQPQPVWVLTERHCQEFHEG